MNDDKLVRVEAFYYEERYIAEVIKQMKIHGMFVASGLEEVDPVYQFVYAALKSSNLIPGSKEK